MSIRSVSSSSKGKRSVSLAGKGHNKVVEADFDDDVAPFAIVAKAYFRREAAFGKAFPPRNAILRENFIMEGLRIAAEELHDPQYISLLKRIASKDEKQFKRLMAFVSCLMNICVYKVFINTYLYLRRCMGRETLPRLLLLERVLLSIITMGYLPRSLDVLLETESNGFSMSLSFALVA